MNLGELIRTIPDFPVKGIMFRDITPLVGNGAAFGEAVEKMTLQWTGAGVAMVASMEARGFILGAPIAERLGAGFVPVRKPGKLPYRTRSVSYELEYRSDVLHVHEDAIRPGQRVLVIDDLMATGGTARAVVDLVEMLGGVVAGVGFLVELAGLRGRDLLAGYDVRSEIIFDGD